MSIRYARRFIFILYIRHVSSSGVSQFLSRSPSVSQVIKKIIGLLPKISGRTCVLTRTKCAFRNYIPRLFNAAANCDWPFINVPLDGAGSTTELTTDTFPPLSSISVLRARALAAERLWFSTFSAPARNVSHVCVRRWIFQRSSKKTWKRHPAACRAVAVPHNETSVDTN